MLYLKARFIKLKDSILDGFIYLTILLLHTISVKKSYLLKTKIFMTFQENKKHYWDSLGLIMQRFIFLTLLCIWYSILFIVSLAGSDISLNQNNIFIYYFIYFLMILIISVYMRVDRKDRTKREQRNIINLISLVVLYFIGFDTFILETKHIFIPNINTVVFLLSFSIFIHTILTYFVNKNILSENKQGILKFSLSLIIVAIINRIIN